MDHICIIRPLEKNYTHDLIFSIIDIKRFCDIKNKKNYML